MFGYFRLRLLKGVCVLCPHGGGAPPLSFGHFPRERGKPWPLYWRSRLLKRYRPMMKGRAAMARRTAACQGVSPLMKGLSPM